MYMLVGDLGAKREGGVEVMVEAGEGGVVAPASPSVAAGGEVGVSGSKRPNPIPLSTTACALASFKCSNTSFATFFLLNRICRIASSIFLPAICRASGANFFMEVGKKWLFARCWRSVRMIFMARLTRPRCRMERISILACQRLRAVGLGLRTKERLEGLRAGGAEGWDWDFWVVEGVVGWDGDGAKMLSGASEPCCGRPVDSLVISVRAARAAAAALRAREAVSSGEGEDVDA